MDIIHAIENLVLHDLLCWRDARVERAEVLYWRMATAHRLHGRRPQMRFLAAVVLTASLVLLSAGLSAAQQPFHITFHRAPDEPTSLVLVGNVSNESSRDVVDVWVTAEALNARGRGVVRGIAFVTSHLPGRASTAFTVKLPRTEEAHSFRVFVSSFRYLFATESP